MTKYLMTLIPALALMIMPATSGASIKDKEGHLLVQLWASYYSAHSADRPQDEADILTSIKKAASEKRLTWDYYDACQKYAEVRIFTDWKLRKQMNEQKAAEIEKYNDPIATYFLRRNDSDESTLLEYIEKNKARMQSSYNPAFYTHGNLSWVQYGKALEKMVRNDYDFALWDIYCSRSGRTPAEAKLKARYADSYPYGVFIKLTAAEREDSDSLRLKRYRSIEADYNGTAAAMLASDAITRIEFDKLIQKGGSSDEYKALRNTCSQITDRIKTFKGNESLIASYCSSAKELAAEMDQKSIDIKAEGCKATVMLRNLSSVRVKMVKDGKTVMDKSLADKQKSYYVPDSLELELPDVDDGDYTLVCSSGKVKREDRYLKNSLSMATRRDASGYSVFVADYIDGRPVNDFRLTLTDNDGKVIKTIARHLEDGFVSIPVTFLPDTPNRYRYTMRAETTDRGRLRLSQSCQLYRTDPLALSNTVEEGSSCMIITDRSAFNPSETVHFKLIAYGNGNSHKVLPGITLKASLVDPTDKEIEHMTLTTGEFGSAAGEFKTPTGGRNGMYTIRISGLDRLMCTAAVQVDEFALPNFSLEWAQDNRLYMPGEEVTISGKLKSYSGKSAGNISASYTIREYRNDIASGSFKTSADGSFSIRFKAADRAYAYYEANVKFTDATGETLAFSKVVSISGDIPMRVELANAAKGRFETTGKNNGRQGSILSADRAELLYKISDRRNGASLTHKGMSINWTLKHDKAVVAEGSAQADVPVIIDMSSMESGLYVLESEVALTSETGLDYKSNEMLNIVKAGDNDKAIHFDAECFFKEIPGESIAMQIGASRGPVWAVADLYSTEGILLDHKMIQLEGIKDKEGSMDIVRFDSLPSYPEDLTLNLLYFHEAEEYSYSANMHNSKSAEVLPLEFSHFLNKTSPSSNYSFEILTAPDTECAASIFDMSTETIRRNVWRAIKLGQSRTLRPDYRNYCGQVGTEPIYALYRNNVYMLGSVVATGRKIAVADMAFVEESSKAAPMDEMVEEEEDSMDSDNVRDDFAATLAWEPFLRSDKDGKIRFDLKTADKLSTYLVQLFAHDKSMRNAVTRKEMMVTIPVQISIVEPQHLYQGDSYVAKVNVSNAYSSDISGTISVSFLNGTDYKTAPVIMTGSKKITVPAGGSADFGCEILTPAIEELGILVSFSSEGAAKVTDKLFVSIPVSATCQTITESHSALLKTGMDRNALESSLRAIFVNMSGESASVKEISILNMLNAAIPASIHPKSSNLMDLSSALYADYLFSKLSGDGHKGLSDSEKSDISARIAACRNSNGGFGWFAGMSSSPIITAAVLERLLLMKDSLPARLSALLPYAVRYLDSCQTGGKDLPIWRGGISLEQYLHVRAMYPETTFAVKNSKELRKFKTEVKNYLLPSGGRGLNGRIIEKARRLQTLRALTSCDEGLRLAEAWGIDGLSASKLRSSLQKDVESIVQYARPHESGGMYYPNAVMPWKGLMESELYAHSMLCDLMEACGHEDIAEGIRLWIMVQKETQQWSDDPAILEALGSVLRGSEATLATTLLSLEASAEKPFDKVLASSNGIEIKREYLHDGKALKGGESLSIGDKITARYTIVNAENRSFVKLSVPRPALLRPVEQRSGNGGWTGNPGYRDIHSDGTDYWLSSCPEGKIVITEEFFVTQEGSFQSPAAQVESLYAPHWHGNDASLGYMTSISEERIQP